MTLPFSRGSVWRKWDLHVHTPATKCNEYKSAIGIDEWDEFCEEIDILF